MASQTTGTSRGPRIRKPWYEGVSSGPGSRPPQTQPGSEYGRRTAQYPPQTPQEHYNQQKQQQQYQQQTQQQQYQQQSQQQQNQQYQNFLRNQQTMQIAKVTAGLVTQCLQNTINDDGFMRGLGARIAGPKGQRGLLDKQEATVHTTLDEQLKAVVEMIEQQSRQVESMLNAMEQKMGGMEAVLTGLAESLAAVVNHGKEGKRKAPATNATRRSRRIAKQRIEKRA